ncbi:unnamed protein product [Bursaphelenchus xylophilus]|uniref:(pine wood nematode) hypothetical protein n=1 Tax=Bursaphelenchus xylophilus TaxID=6326 RepID=A0A1I7S118_BURXY|nr:unnamed protein product [Bursaphelenchus xylophilus]CAG9088023.1 unnamed protein product [Bursaphelenchus xylophilus]
MGSDSSSGEGEETYVVEKILNHRKIRGKKEYLIKWQGYDDPADNTWEPVENCDCPELIEAYESAQAELSEKKKKTPKSAQRENKHREKSETPASTTSRKNKSREIINDTDSDDSEVVVHKESPKKRASKEKESERKKSKERTASPKKSSPKKRIVESEEDEDAPRRRAKSHSQGSDSNPRASSTREITPVSNAAAKNPNGRLPSLMSEFAFVHKDRYRVQDESANVVGVFGVHQDGENKNNLWILLAFKAGPFIELDDVEPTPYEVCREVCPGLLLDYWRDRLAFISCPDRAA